MRFIPKSKILYFEIGTIFPFFKKVLITLQSTYLYLCYFLKYNNIKMLMIDKFAMTFRICDNFFYNIMFLHINLKDSRKRRIDTYM